MELLSTSQTKERISYRFSLENYKDYNALEVDVYYRKGGNNWYNGNQETRGYCVSLQPCEVYGYSVRAMPNDGIKMFLKEVKRQSQKAFKEAISFVDKDILLRMVNYMRYPLTDEDINFIIETLKERNDINV